MLFFCISKTKISKKQKRPPIGLGDRRFFTLLSSQNMIPQKSRVSYLEKFKMVQTHRAHMCNSAEYDLLTHQHHMKNQMQIKNQIKFSYNIALCTLRLSVSFALSLTLSFCLLLSYTYYVPM